MLATEEGLEDTNLRLMFPRADAGRVMIRRGPGTLEEEVEREEDVRWKRDICIYNDEQC